MNCDFGLLDITSTQGHDTPLGWSQQSCEKLSRSNIEVRNYDPDKDFSYVCTVTLTLEMSPWVRSWHTLALSSTIMWNIIQIQLNSKKLWYRQRFYLRVHFDLDHGNLTLDQGHDTPLGRVQQVCEILSRSNLAVRSYGIDKDFSYVCTVTLTLETWPWVEVIIHPWVEVNNHVKYYPDPTKQ